MMSWLILPAVLALLIKLYMLAKQYKKTWINYKWISLVGSLAALNLSEVLIYSSYINANYSDFILRSYFIFYCISLTYSCAYVSNTDKYPIQKFVLYAHYLIALLLTCSFFTSTAMINGYSDNGIFVTAIKGDYFWAFQCFLITSVSLSLASLIFNYLSEDDKSIKIGYAYTMLGFAPLGITILVISTLMLLGFNANGSGLIPIATTLFLLITATGKSPHLLKNDPRALVPITKEAELQRIFSKVRTQSSLGRMPLKDAINTIEFQIISYTLNKNSGNMSLTARDLGMSRSTLYGLSLIHI